MPPEAFADLWTTLKAGRPWSGLVKNRNKTGILLGGGVCLADHGKTKPLAMSVRNAP